jgi:ABC-type sugar transport system, permease component
MSRTASPQSMRAYKAKRRILHILLITLTVLIAALVAFPLYWMLRGSIVTKPEFLARPPVFFPAQVMLSNFGKALERINFLNQLWNSVSIAVPYVLGNVVTTCVSGYAFAKLRFPMRNMWFALIISTMMLPSAVTLLPQYSMYAHFGWIGTKLPLIIPAFFCSAGNAYFVFLFRQFFKTIPNELNEAAKIDGAGYFKTFCRIMVPLVKPAIIVVALFSFVNCWNEFFYSLIYLQGEKMYTLPMGLYMVNGLKINNYEQVMALAIIVTSPCLIFFLIGNKYFVKGITLTGIKG